MTVKVAVRPVVAVVIVTLESRAATPTILLTPEQFRTEVSSAIKAVLLSIKYPVNVAPVISTGSLVAWHEVFGSKDVISASNSSADPVVLPGDPELVQESVD